MGKLMKYDLRAAMKLFVPLWLGTLILSFVNSFSVNVPDTSNQIARFFISLAMIAYVLAILAIVIITAVYIVLRFYQGTMKDEGYLTFTLPVGIDSILWSKALSGIIVLCGSVVVCVLSVVILASPAISWREVSVFFDLLWNQWRTADVLLCGLMFLLLLFTSCLSGIFQVYLSMGFGQMAQKHKIGASVLAYVLISIAVSALTSLIAGSVLFDTVVNWEESFMRNFHELQVVWISLALVSLYNLIFAAIYYFPTRYIFKNRLNLE